MTEAQKNPDRTGLPYRPCVGIALINRAGLVFIGRRRASASEPAGGEGAWQMPQGGIDEGESPRDAALRELYEETSVGAGSVTWLAETHDWLAYDLPADLTGTSWKGRYRGQRQKWFAFGFTGEDGEIDVAAPGGGRHKAEFDAWRWEPMAALPGLIVPFKRPVYEGVVAAFAGLADWRGRA